MHRSLLAVALATAAGLTACQDGHRPVAGICKDFAKTAPIATEGAAVVEDCLHRWAYSLAGSRDDAGTVADAVIAACRAPLSRWNQQGLTAVTPEATSLLTGEPSNPIAEHANFTKDRALFYVVQARAGACKAPPKRESTAAMNTPDA